MTRFSLIVASLLALTVPSIASAQSASTPAPATTPTRPPAAAQGPLVLERVHNGIVVAPDYKVTQVDGDLGQLAGAYVGRVLDDRLLVGGAGYWMTNGGRDTDLRYGGLVVGWQTAPARIRFGARGLVGGGQGTVRVPFGRAVDPRVAAGVRDAGPIVARFGARGGAALVPPGSAVPSSIRVREGFMVFEPQLNTVTTVTNHIAVDLAVGYRVIGMADTIGDRLDGATCSLGFQLAW